MRSRAVEVVYGPGTFLNRAVAAVNSQVQGLLAGVSTSVATHEPGRLPARDRPRARQSSGAQGRRRGRPARRPAAAAVARAARRPVGDHVTAVDRLAPVHPGDRVRPAPGGQPAQGAVRVPVPDRELGPDPDPPEVVAVRQPAGAGDLVDPPGDQDADVPLGLRRDVHRERRAGGHQRPRQRHHGVDRRAADRGAARDGDHAPARVQKPSEAAAAGDRARRRRDHVRPARGDRRHADDGLDRGAADPDRARGRRRDPVPVPRAQEALGDGSGRATASSAWSRARGRAGGRPRRADDRDRGARDRNRLPRAAALAGADGPRLRPAARGRDRGCVLLRADRRIGRAGAQRARARAGARHRGPARPRALAAPVRGAGEILRAGDSGDGRFAEVPSGRPGRILGGALRGAARSSWTPGGGRAAPRGRAAGQAPARTTAVRPGRS